MLFIVKIVIHHFLTLKLNKKGFMPEIPSRNNHSLKASYVIRRDYMNKYVISIVETILTKVEIIVIRFSDCIGFPNRY